MICAIMEPMGLGKTKHFLLPITLRCIFCNGIALTGSFHTCLMLSSPQVTQATTLAKLKMSPSNVYRQAAPSSLGEVLREGVDYSLSDH